MRFANFLAPWTVDDFDFTAQPTIDEAMIREPVVCRGFSHLVECGSSSSGVGDGLFGGLVPDERFRVAR